MNKRIFLALLAPALAIGALAQEAWQIGDPSISAYAYLNSYGNLKDYINYEKYPNFKLGVGTTASEYNQKSTVYRMTNANFTETVTGNAMKMASCVSSDGSMNFTTVKNFVKNASEAGLNIYGHVLAWHSQQPITWLSSLMKDKPAEEITDPDAMVYELLASKNFTIDQTIGDHSDYTKCNYTITFDSTDGMKVTNTKKTRYYVVQYTALDGFQTEDNGTVRMVITIKGSEAGTLYAKLCGTDTSTGTQQTLDFTTEWQDVTLTFTNAAAASSLLLQSGNFLGDIYIKKIELKVPTKGKTINEKRRCIVVNATAKENANYDNQFWILTGDFAKGSTYEFSADVRADAVAKATTQIHTTPGTYVNYAAIGDVDFPTNWATVKSSGTFDYAGSSIAFNLSEYADANKYYFDNVSLKINGKETVVNGDFEGTSVESFKQKTNRGSVVDPTIVDSISYIYVPAPTPQTAQEVHDTLVYAMDKWIHGIMTACDGKVKAWDVVNEALSGGGNDGSGYYILQHRDGYVPGSTTWDVGGDAFYWQDYMGDLEYVRQAVRLARKYGPEDIKLFINDYNLESDWDSNKKLKSLIHWIEKWESDGVTHIDGIGTQMHISFYANTSTQNSKKNAITNMFKLMAATGRLVRVSEMDMGYVNTSGKSVATGDMTEAQHKQMADFYKWIIQQYLTLIPAAQQWGICQWCATDSPAGSGWRADTPVGWWTLNKYRKHSYAGVCEGLGGVNYADGIDEVEADAPSAGQDNIVYDLQGRRVQNPTHGIYIINGNKFVKH